MLSVEEAQDIILEKISPLNEMENIPLLESIGRVLAKDVLAPFDQPPFSNSAMDGFALRSTDVTNASLESPVVLEVSKFQSAGSDFCELPLNCAIEIATGAPLPRGSDAVMMKEDVKPQDGKIIVTQPLKRGENVRNQGEDLLEGTQLFLKGEKIKEKNVGLLASFGFASVEVIRKPRIAYVATGDEIVKAGEMKKEHQIYNSNALSLKALFKKEGCEFFDFGICRDSISELNFFIKKALETKPDIFVLTGGVSVGRHDFVRQILEENGAEIFFHKVSVKPGKPLLFAKFKDSFVFGLPGNPLSSQVGFYQFIYPAIQKLLNAKKYFLEQEMALLQGEIFKNKRHLFLIGFKKMINETITVIPFKEGSGNVASFSLGNCLISIPPGSGKLEKNSLVTIQDYV